MLQLHCSKLNGSEKCGPVHCHVHLGISNCDNPRCQQTQALILLDDVTSIASCQNFLPKANRFRVLMTTRLRNLDPNIEEISLDVMSQQEALQLLTALVGTLRVQKEQEVAKQLCEWLGDLPLGLELVGHYLAEDPDFMKDKTCMIWLNLGVSNVY